MRRTRGVHAAHGQLRVWRAGARSVRGVSGVAGTRAGAGGAREGRTQHAKLDQLARSGTVVRQVPSDRPTRAGRPAEADAQIKRFRYHAGAARTPAPAPVPVAREISARGSLRQKDRHGEGRGPTFATRARGCIPSFWYAEDCCRSVVGLEETGQGCSSARSTNAWDNERMWPILCATGHLQSHLWGGRPWRVNLCNALTMPPRPN